MKPIRILLNGWLIAVALDGAVRVLAGLMQMAFSGFPSSVLITPVELVVVVGSVVAWFLVAASARVPIRVVLPPMIALIWLFCGALPFSVIWFNQPAMQVACGVVLLLAAGASELLARTVGHGRWFLAAEPLGETSEFSPRRLVGWVAGWLFLAPVAVGIYAVLGATWTLSWGTAGFLTMTPTGLAAAHKVYILDGDTIDLVAMVHLGEASAYEDLFRAIPTQGSLVLAEGVSDEQGLLTAPRDAYQSAASAVGLSVQRPIDQIAPFEVQNADVDVSTFAPVSLELLNAALGIYGSPDHPQQALMDYLEFWQGHRSDANLVIDQLFADILESRNAHLLEQIEAARVDRDRLVVPWGALHMVGVEQALKDRGWTHTQTDKVVLIRWSTVF